jgi:PhnB protein
MITPYLLYEDVAGAMRFLSKAFGFKKSGSAMSGKSGKLTHAAMKLGDDLIMMGYPGPRYKNPKKLGEARRFSTSK